MSKKQLNIAGVQSELAQSVYFARPAAPRQSPQRPRPSVSKRNQTAQVKPVRKSRTPGLPQSGTPEVPQLRAYELRKYDQFRRLDVRLTREQLRFLQDMEDDIREAMPEVEQDNPGHRRITKSAIVRVLVEMFRQLHLAIDPSQFHNEHDLMDELYRQLVDRLRQFRSAEVPQ